MSSDTKKSASPTCSHDVLNWSWMSLANLSASEIKDHGFILLLITLSLFNLWKFKIIQRIWAKSRHFLPNWLSGRSIDKRIDVLTTDLRMEMRESTEQIIEFQKWSQVTSLVESSRGKSHFCRQCGGKMLPSPAEVRIYRSNVFNYPTVIDNEMSECNWLQYLRKYVYNPNPRILDTSELENTKRAYSM